MNKKKILITTMLSLLCTWSSFGRDYHLNDVWKAYDSFNQYLLDNKKGIYKTDTSFEQATDRWNGAAAIWCQPMYLDMAMNATRLAQREKDKKRENKYRELSKQILLGNEAQYCGFNFHDNNENTGWFIYDDIQWWTITLARAYEFFGDKKYLQLAEQSFSRVWYGSDTVGDTGSYANPEKGLGGGMFWQWQPIRNPHPNRRDHGKMACINFPTVVAAMTLYNLVPSRRKTSLDAKPQYQTAKQYLQKAKEIYAWGVDNLYNPATGCIADSRHGNGEPAWKAHVYNQATFIGASALLYKATKDKSYLKNAIKATDYTIEVMSAKNQVLPFESGIEQGIYTAIFAQYVAMLVYDCNQKQYLPFLHHTITCGWKNRDKSRNICGGDYSQPLPEMAKIDSYSASGIPALMLLFPPLK